MTERLLAKVEPEPNTGCWIWIGKRGRDGYGTITRGPRAARQAFKTHRLIYELAKGPIPAGLQIDHLCRVRCCVNPAHLEPVTQKVNILRGVGFSATHARKRNCPQGHPYDMRLADGGRACRICVTRNQRNTYQRIKSDPVRYARLLAYLRNWKAARRRAEVRTGAGA